MGQYYLGINLDKREILDPHRYKNGAKLMEHSYIQNKILNVAEHLLSPSGSWYKNRLVWAGDYMDQGIFIEAKAEKGDIRALFPENKNLYSYADEHFEPVILDVPYNKNLRYIINHTKQQFVDKEKVRAGWGDLQIHPLPLLTSSGNGRGGGDYRGYNRFVGSWAGDIISIETSKLDGFNEILPDFYEN